MTAGIAMTIAHTCGCAGHRELDSPTETTSIVGLWTVHNASPQLANKGSSTSVTLRYGTLDPPEKVTTPPWCSILVNG